MQVVVDNRLYSATCDEFIRSIPLFYTPIWLDSVYGHGLWKGYVLIKENSVKAIFPVCIKKRFGFTAFVMPPLTPYLSMWIINQADYNHYNEYLLSFLTIFPKTIMNGLSAYVTYDRKEIWLELSYELNAKNTYIFPWQSYDTIYRNYSPQMKRDLNRMAEKIEVLEQDHVDDLYAMIEYTFAAQGLKVPVSKSLLARIKGNLPQRSTIISARYQGSIVACILVVNDDLTSYYLLSGRNNDAPNGTVTFLIDYAIKKAMDQRRNFDFEGSSIESIARFFRSFGAQHHTYIHAVKYANKLVKWIAQKKWHSTIKVKHHFS